MPARAFSFCRAKRDNQSEFRSKKVRASFSNCDQVRHCEFCGQFVGSLAPPSAELEAVFRKAKCAAKKDVALAPTHPCAGNDKELPKNFDKYMIKNYSIQQSIVFLTNSPSFPINPFFSVSFLFIALSSIFLISPTLSSFILRPQNSE